MNKKEISFTEFVLLMALMMALVSVSINMLLPAFSIITEDLGLTSENQIQLSISLLYLGLGLSQLFYGTLSDSIGRKRAVYVGLAMFMVGCLVSYMSANLPTLLIGQVMQGAGLGAPRVLSLAIVRDTFSGNQMARAISFALAIFILTPVVSPMASKWFLGYFEWRALFLLFLCFGVLLFLLFKFRMTETLPLEKRQTFRATRVLRALGLILRHKASITYTLILGLYTGVFITYLNLSQALFEFHFELGDAYPFYFAVLALGLGVALFVNGKLVVRFGMYTLTRVAILSSIVIDVLFLVGLLFQVDNLWLFMVFMLVQLFNFGILSGNLNALAMQPLGHIAGLGASVIGAVSTIISVPLSIFIGWFYHDSTWPIGLGFFCVSVLALILFMLNPEKNEHTTN